MLNVKSMPPMLRVSDGFTSLFSPQRPYKFKKSNEAIKTTCQNIQQREKKSFERKKCVIVDFILCVKLQPCDSKVQSYGMETENFNLVLKLEVVFCECCMTLICFEYL